MAGGLLSSHTGIQLEPHTIHMIFATTLLEYCGLPTKSQTYTMQTILCSMLSPPTRQHITHSQPSKKTKAHIPRLPPLPFHQGFTISKLISFASWETVAYRPMEICFATCIQLFWVIEPGLLWWELTATTTLLQTIIAPSKRIRPNPSWSWKNFATCHRHPSTNWHYSQPYSHFVYTRSPQYHKNFRVNTLPSWGSNWDLCGGSLMPWALGYGDSTIAAIPEDHKHTLC